MPFGRVNTFREVLSLANISPDTFKQLHAVHTAGEGRAPWKIRLTDLILPTKTERQCVATAQIFLGDLWGFV